MEFGIRTLSSGSTEGFTGAMETVGNIGRVSVEAAGWCASVVTWLLD